MLKYYLFYLVVLTALMVQSQGVTLPADFRQHNLTEYNSSLLSPVFSLDRNNPESIALWSRWQWQSIDGDPTTLFLNYTRRLDSESTMGIGFFQHNTGTFLQTGGVINYGYALELKSNAQIAFGLNLFGYQRKLADDRFQPDPDIGLPILVETNNFILQLAPSLRFKLDRFSIGIVAENLFDYNFTTKEKETRPTDKIYIGLASYSFPVTIFGSSEESFLQPTLYLKTMPNLDNQYGLTTLFSTPKFWVQAGYNNFYGISGGLGGRFFKKISLGVLMEFGTSTGLDGTDPSFEIVTAYSFGSGDDRKKVVGFGDEDEEVPLDEIEKEKAEEEKIEEESVKAEALAREKEKQQLEEKARIADRERVRDSIAATKREETLTIERVRQQKTLDSIATVKKGEALAETVKIREQKTRDSIAAVKTQEALAEVKAAEKKAELDKIAQLKKADKPKEGEKYEEVATEDGLEPGYYLITNVFGTKKYFDSFMKTLTDKGLQPKSFFRNLNKYNYVYLERYNTMTEARRARDSKFNGRYQGKTWIFRVVGN